MKSTYSKDQSTYVLDDISSEQIDIEVKKLKTEIGNNINLSFENAPFKKLKDDLLALIEQSH